MNNQITIELLEELESKALTALVRQAADGNAGAASAAQPEVVRRDLQAESAREKTRLLDKLLSAGALERIRRA